MFAAEVCAQDAGSFEMHKSRGLQNRESLLRKKSRDAQKRHAKEIKKLEKAHKKEKAILKAKKVPTSYEEYLPPQTPEERQYSADIFAAKFDMTASQEGKKLCKKAQKTTEAPCEADMVIIEDSEEDVEGSWSLV